MIVAFFNYFWGTDTAVNDWGFEWALRLAI